MIVLFLHMNKGCSCNPLKSNMFLSYFMSVEAHPSNSPVVFSLTVLQWPTVCLFIFHAHICNNEEKMDKSFLGCGMILHATDLPQWLHS